MLILRNTNVLKTSGLLIALVLIGHGFENVKAQDNGSASLKQSNVLGLQSASPPSSSNQKVNKKEDASLTGKCSERCSYGYGSRMRKINAQTDACQERCSVLPFVSKFMTGWECGNCADWKSSVAGFDMQLTVEAPDKFKQAFYDAAAKWKSVITGDLPSVNARGSLMKALSSCPASSMPNVVDDVFICGSVTDIDGPGRVLGMSGAEFVRRPNGLPVIGLMRFDEADVEMLVTMGSFNGVILHEMGHVLGFARNIFHSKGIITSIKPPCSYDADSRASREWQNMTGCPDTVAIPIEQNGGSGTACSHWSEWCLRGELMTGYLGKDSGLELSRMTVAALEDLGYEVDYSAADSFNDFNTSCIESMCRSGGSRTLEIFQSEEQEHRTLQDDKGKQEAIDYGKQYLMSKRTDTSNMRLQEDITYNADQAVFIVYLGDDGDVHSIVVEND